MSFKYSLITRWGWANVCQTQPPASTTSRTVAGPCHSLLELSRTSALLRWILTPSSTGCPKKNETGLKLNFSGLLNVHLKSLYLLKTYVHRFILHIIFLDITSGAIQNCLTKLRNQNYDTKERGQITKNQTNINTGGGLFCLWGLLEGLLEERRMTNIEAALFIFKLTIHYFPLYVLLS